MAGPLDRVGSCLWSSANALARVAADRRVIKRAGLGCRVVSVGNIQAGGAGKTPLVAQVVREAQERGLLAAILTRGYGGRWERDGGMIEPGQEAVDPDACG